MTGYTNLIEKLHGFADIYGLYYPPRYNCPGVNLIEYLGMFFMRCIETVEIEGPLFFIGWSLGGLIAYECTSQPNTPNSLKQTVLVDSAPFRTLVPALPVVHLELLDHIWNAYIHVKCVSEDAEFLLKTEGLMSLNNRERFAKIKQLQLELGGPYAQKTRIRWDRATSYRVP